MSLWDDTKPKIETPSSTNEELKIINVQERVNNIISKFKPPFNLITLESLIADLDSIDTSAISILFAQINTLKAEILSEIEKIKSKK